jgi:hypothetical protein
VESIVELGTDGATTEICLCATKCTLCRVEVPDTVWIHSPSINTSADRKFPYSQSIEYGNMHGFQPSDKTIRGQCVQATCPLNVLKDRTPTPACTYQACRPSLHVLSSSSVHHHPFFLLALAHAGTRLFLDFLA